MTTPAPSLTEQTAQIASAHCANKQLPADMLPALIRQIHQALVDAGAPAAMPAEKPEPAVPVRRSVFPDYIVCLEDGKKLKMLERYLQAAYGMTPEQDRERWDLPPDYPMTAAQLRRAAERAGQGDRAGSTRNDQDADPQDGHEPGRRGRSGKAA